MYLYNVVAITLIIVGFLFSMQGLWLVCRALWPQRVAACAGRCERNGLKSFLVGIPVTAVVTILAAVVAQIPGGAGGQIAFWVMFVYVMYAGVGMAGFVTHIGRRLESPKDVDAPWRTTLRGGIVLELAYLIPLFGQVGLLPLSFVMGAGAMTLSFFGRKGAAVPPFHQANGNGGTIPLPVPAAGFEDRASWEATGSIR